MVLDDTRQNASLGLGIIVSSGPSALGVKCLIELMPGTGPYGPSGACPARLGPSSGGCHLGRDINIPGEEV